MGLKRILVTGANGYLGSRVADYLADAGYDIIAHCNSKIPQDTGWKQKMFQIVQGDIRSKDTLDQISAHRPEAIIHLISLDHIQSGKDVHQTMEVNVQATWDLLELAKLCGTNRFIYFSTIHVYGSAHKRVINENSVPAPANVYGLTHLLSEQIVSFMHRNSPLNAVNLRLSNSYGDPRIVGVNCWQLVVNDLCRSAFHEKKIVLQSEGTAIRDFIHYSTVCKAIVNLLEQPEKQEVQTWNLCSGRSIRLIDLARMVSSEYTKRYGVALPVMVNGNQPVALSEDAIEYVDQFAPNALTSAIADSASLNRGIELLFEYLEKTPDAFS